MIFMEMLTVSTGFDEARRLLADKDFLKVRRLDAMLGGS